METKKEAEGVGFSVSCRGRRSPTNGLPSGASRSSLVGVNAGSGRQQRGEDATVWPSLIPSLPLLREHEKGVLIIYVRLYINKLIIYCGEISLQDDKFSDYDLIFWSSNNRSYSKYSSIVFDSWNIYTLQNLKKTKWQYLSTNSVSFLHILKKI